MITVYTVQVDSADSEDLQTVDSTSHQKAQVRQSSEQLKSIIITGVSPPQPWVSALSSPCCLIGQNLKCTILRRKNAVEAFDLMLEKIAQLIKERSPPLTSHRIPLFASNRQPCLQLTCDHTRWKIKKITNNMLPILNTLTML